MSDGTRRSPVAVRLSEEGVHVTVAYAGGPPTREDFEWRMIGAWSRAPGQRQMPDGITLLLRTPPFFYWIVADADGADDLLQEMVARGLSELPQERVTEVAERARQARVEEYLAKRFDDATRAAVLADLDASPFTASARVRLAILSLSKGNVSKVHELAQVARRDWRDVVWWADSDGYGDV
ncbi:MAG: hypothetical protein JWO05_720 [Gemmatimonadetes bacterium]|nr:hypothetical protein [Gemmatimonadota bacterium]